MARYLFAFEVKSTGKKGEFSWSAETEEEAREKVLLKIADFEFSEVEDILLGDLLEVKATTGNQYYECEGCSA
ncbi:hypothetical protein [Paenibacillus nasutitermitis]|uniref:Uncharacterized protein n=1 Tax=Paenibacillus nasutitermitis TaxID=1652958 RepID=A0A916YM29_9BACL|nr:hypothetical protein [Paenibacillus nasutitermitis]GGD51058.1 hypothetical protein GCM10010911_05740 [Paenibacillus nasutitermitis]